VTVVDSCLVKVTEAHRPRLFVDIGTMAWAHLPPMMRRVPPGFQVEGARMQVVEVMTCAYSKWLLHLTGWSLKEVQVWLGNSHRVNMTAFETCAEVFEGGVAVFGRQTIDVAAPETEIAGRFRSEVVAHGIIWSNAYWRGQCGACALVHLRHGAVGISEFRKSACQSAFRRDGLVGRHVSSSGMDSEWDPLSDPGVRRRSCWRGRSHRQCRDQMKGGSKMSGASQRRHQRVSIWRPTGMVGASMIGLGKMWSKCLVGKVNDRGSVTMERASMACWAESSPCRPPRRPLFYLNVICVKDKETLFNLFPLGKGHASR
jgi:hypothetical protein